MTISWAGWESYLAQDVSSTDTTFVLGFDTDMPGTPFDFTIGLERCTAVDRPSPNHITVNRGVNNTPRDAHYGGPECGIAEIRHQLLVYHGGALFCDLTAIAESCEVDYVMPGGMSQAVISFTTYDPARYFPNPDATLILSSNESGGFRPYSKGYLGVPKETRLDDGAYHYELTFFGMMDTLGEGGDEYIDTKPPVAGYYDSGVGWWAAFTPIHQVIQDAIRDLAYYTISLNFSHVIDGGQQIGKEYNALWKTALQVINELCAQGDTGVALDWAIFTESDGSSVLWLLRRDRWSVINIPWSIVSPPSLPDELPLSWNSREQRNRVIVKYGSGGMPALAVGAGRPKALHRDVSNIIQDSSTAYNMAKTILSEVQEIQSLTEKPVVFQYRADDPATKYLTDGSTEIPIWRGEEIVGRKGRITGVTATNPNWPITLMQIKTYHVSHTNRSGTAQLGKYVDWTAELNRYGFQDAKRPDSAIHTPGASSAFAAPAAAAPPNGATTSNVPTIPPSSTGIGPHKVMDDLDIASPQWVYDDPAGDALPAGEYGDISMSLSGHILSFKVRLRTGANAAASGVFAIWRGHGSGAPTLIRTITVASKLEDEDVLPVAAIVEVTAGDYLRLKITSTTAAHVTIRPTFRRTGGSDRPVSAAGAVIQNVSTNRNADTGVITFDITADRPCRAWVVYDIQANGPYRSVTGTTTELSKHPKPATYAIPEGVTMHGKVHLQTADLVETIGPDFAF